MTKTLVKMIFGSHLYGLNNENSDMDYKGVFCPTADEILLQKANYSISESTGDDNSKNGADDTDTEMFSYQRFIELASKGETVAIDMLHAPKEMILESSPEWEWLVENRSMFYTKNMKAYIGYVRKQAAKYGVKGSRLNVIELALTTIEGVSTNGYVLRLGDIMHMLPINEHAQIVESDFKQTGKQIFYEICGRKLQDTLSLREAHNVLKKIFDNYGARAHAAKNNEGIDWKAISHALRAGYQAFYIYQKGGFEYPLPETQFLKDVKEGKLDYLTEVQPVLDDLVVVVTEMAENSSYPDKVHSRFTDDLVRTTHLDIIENEFFN